MNCVHCKLVYDERFKFCPNCGNKLKPEKTQVVMYIGPNGPTSISYRLPGGITLNSKNGTTVSLGNGISYTTK
jgi:hypothetical protein